MSEIEREYVKLTEEMLMELIRGKKLTLQFWGKYEVNIIPPKYGITLTHDEWKEILNEFMPCSNKSFELINKIQSKF